MVERRSWEQMKEDNAGADWIVDGKLCKNYVRDCEDENVKKILQQQRKDLGLQEWQLPGFNGCWSCDKINGRHFQSNKPCKG